MQAVILVLLSLTHTTTSSSEFRFCKRGIEDEAPLSKSLNDPGPLQYPMTDSSIKALPSDTKADSLRTENSTQVRTALSTFNNFEAADKNEATSVRSYEDFLGEDGVLSKFKPTHPDATTNSEKRQFWLEFNEVVALRALRELKVKTKKIMPVHRLFDKDETIMTSSLRVKSDFPSYFPTEQLLKWATEDDVEGTNQGKTRWGSLVLDSKITHTCNNGKGVEFINAQVMLAELIGWAIRTVSPACFGLKWSEGRARPEEVSYCVGNGADDTQCPVLVPPNIIKRTFDKWVKLSEKDSYKYPNMNLYGKAANAFTAYETGSPIHPSYPAMHSAASSMSTWIDVVADLTDDQRAEVRLLDYSIAYYRSLAGVHYPSDNRAGLALGQNILEKQLPKFLAERFSCDDESKKNIFDHVTEKIESNKENHKLDWATYKPGDYFWDDMDAATHHGSIAMEYKKRHGQVEQREYWNEPIKYAESRNVVAKKPRA